MCLFFVNQIVDTLNHCLRLVTVSTKYVMTLAGNAIGQSIDGSNTEAQFNLPVSLVMVYQDNGDNDDEDGFDYALITEENVIRTATFQYTFDESVGNSQIGNSSSSRRIIFYVILAGVVFGFLIFYYAHEHFTEMRRKVKYNVVKRTINVKSKSYDNLPLEDGLGEHKDEDVDSIVSGAKSNHEEDPEYESTDGSNTPEMKAAPKIYHNHLLEPPKPKRQHNTLQIERSNMAGRSKRSSSIQKLDENIEEKQSDTDKDEFTIQPPTLAKKAKSKENILLKKKYRVEKREEKIDISEEPKQSFWLSGKLGKKSKENKQKSKQEISDDSGVISDGKVNMNDGRSKGEKSDGSTVTKAKRSKSHTRKMMRSMSATSDGKVDSGLTLAQQREKHDERKRQKLLREKERLEKIAFSRNKNV